MRNFPICFAPVSVKTLLSPVWNIQPKEESLGTEHVIHNIFRISNILFELLMLHNVANKPEEK